MQVRHPIWLRRVGAPGAEAIGVLFALESLVRSLLATIIPLEALRLLGGAQQVSVLFFFVSFAGLGASFAVPWLVHRSARRWVYSLGAVMLAIAAALLAFGTLPTQALGMAARVIGTVALNICLNLYIMDNIGRADLARSEPLRLFYSSAAWIVGPALGVYLARNLAPWAPYAASAAGTVALLAYFWVLRLRDGTAIRPASSPPANPLRSIDRYFRQPRLALAWLIAVGRNAWWAMFFIYTPIYAIQSGLGEQVGGLLVSGGLATMFALPLWGRLARRLGMRRHLVNAFGAASLATLGVAVAIWLHLPWLGAGLLLAAAFAIVSLDAVGNMPFMLAVHPQDRRDMTPVFATYRDIAEMAPPGAFSLLLRLFELPAVYAAAGLTMIGLAALCRRMHPRLGRERVRPGALPPLQARPGEA